MANINVTKVMADGAIKKSTGMSDAEIQEYLRQQNSDKMDRVYNNIPDDIEQPQAPTAPKILQYLIQIQLLQRLPLMITIIRCNDICRKCTNVREHNRKRHIRTP